MREFERKTFQPRFADAVLADTVIETLDEHGWVPDDEAGPIVSDRPIRDAIVVLRPLPAECAVVQQFALDCLAAAICDDSIG